MDNTMQKVYEQKETKFMRNYGELITEAHDAHDSTLHGTKNPWTIYDTCAIGKYLETWEEMLPVFESDPTIRSSLGDILNVGLGLVALQYATLPITAFASVQPLDDEAGTIYYRRLMATMTRGAYTADNLIMGATPGDTVDDAYYSEEQLLTYTVLSGDVSSTTTTKTLTLMTPVRPRDVRISVTHGASTYNGIDDGQGNVYGQNIQGTINYANGALALVITATAAADVINVIYDQNLAEADTLPGFKWDLSTKVVRANYFLIQSQFSTFAEYTIKRRFGRILADDVAADAVAQINGAVLTSGIKKLKAASLTNDLPTINWDATPLSGESIIEHRMTFTDVFEQVMTAIGNQTGRGAISFIIAGSKIRTILRSLGFKPEAKNIPGPYLAGYHEGIPVFFASSSLIADNEALFGYRGTMWFESALVYSPYLPITTVRGQVGLNLFKSGVASAHAAAIDTVVSDFVQRVTVTGM
jgi:hypothetical protein